MKKILLTSILISFLAASCNSAQPTTQYQPANNPPTQQQAQDKTTTIKVAVILTGDNGKLGTKIGCDDSVVFISRTVPYTLQTLDAAMKELFNLGSTKISGAVVGSDLLSNNLYNVIYEMQQKSEYNNSPLKYDHVILTDGTAKIYLTGNMAGLGGICDTPRVQPQIEQTAKQFSTVSSVETYLNGNKVDWVKFNSQQ